MINFIKILLQFGSFKIQFMKIELNFILRKISENSVHENCQISRYLCNIKML